MPVRDPDAAIRQNAARFVPPLAPTNSCRSRGRGAQLGCQGP